MRLNIVNIFKKSTESSAVDEELALLGRHAGVGLWDAVLFEGDYAHPKSAWRWSGEFRRLLGFEQDDFRSFPDVASSWGERLHADDAPATLKAFEACLADRSGRTRYDVRYRLKTRDGSYRWFRAVGGVARDGNGRPLRACGSLIDIDAEHNELERSAVLDRHAGVGLWDSVLYNGDTTDPRSTWRWSGGFRALLGFDPGDEKGFPNTAAAWVDRLHPEDAQKVLGAFDSYLKDRSGKARYDVTYRMKMRTGEYRWFRAMGGAVRDGQGVPLRACGSLIDIDAEKQAETERVQAEAARHKLVADLSETLETEVGALANRASTSAETVAAATEELSASIAEVNERAAEAAVSSANASAETKRTGSGVQALLTAAERIGTITSLINDIAGQTNLLALNATIEAARAGEAGKGFAVVAGEVKQLAKQSARATEDIVAHVQSVQSEARQAFEAIRAIGTIVDEVQNVSAAIAAAVAQQDAATREIAASVSTVVSHIGEVGDRITQTASKLRA